jgi:heme exporter protein D
MAFDSLAEFIAMGKHGFYVWLAYGATVTALIGLVVFARRRNRLVWRELADEDYE